MPIFAKTPVPSVTEIALVPVPKRVDRGIRLQRIVKRAAEELDKLKASLRGEANERRLVEPNLSPVHFQGTIGTAKVTYKDDSIKAKDGTKAVELKGKLPANLYNNLFDEETVAKPCKDFKKKLAMVSPESRAVIMEYFENVPNTPAVEFSK